MSYDKNKYAEMYRRPEWQRKRLQIMSRDGFMCFCCCGKDKTLNVHHSYYVKGRKPWEYPCFSLLTLCEDCHKARHSIEESLEGEAMLMVWESSLDDILGGEYEVLGDIQSFSMAASSAIMRLMESGMDRGEAMREIASLLSDSFNRSN